MLISCIFCGEDCDRVEELKEHSATCSRHPAVIRLKGAKESRRHVYRLGSLGNSFKWVVTLENAEGDVEKDLPKIVETLKRLYDNPSAGAHAVVSFNYVEYLGEG